MAVVIPIRFEDADPVRRDRIVTVLKQHGMEVRRTAVEGLGELYLMRANADAAARTAIVDLLERHVPDWRAAARFYWPE